MHNIPPSVQELQDRKDFCCGINWSHLACGVKDRSFEMSFFRCLSLHSSTCPLVPGTHSIHYLQSVANSCDEDFVPTSQEHTHSIHCSHRWPPRTDCLGLASLLILFTYLLCELPLLQGKFRSCYPLVLCVGYQ